MYIVTINRPYYPSVDYYQTLREAEKAYESMISETDDEGELGTYETSITLAKVISNTDITTLF
jgi:hypothetical protein